MDGVREFLQEQARAYICGEFGCFWKVILPVQTRGETGEVLCGCSTCGGKRWIKLSPDGYKHFLKDLADGKIK